MVEDASHNSSLGFSHQPRENNASTIRNHASYETASNGSLSDSGSKTGNTLATSAKSHNTVLENCIECFEKANVNKHVLKDLSKALERWSNAERVYGISISNTPIRQYGGFCPGANCFTTANSALDTLKSNFSMLSEMHAQLGSSFSSMGQQLDALERKNCATVSKLESEEQTRMKELQSKIAILQRNKSKYLKCCMKAEESIEQQEKAQLENSTADHRRLTTRTQNTINAVQESEITYKQAVQETQVRQSEYAGQMQRLVMELNVLEESRLGFVKVMLNKIVEECTKFSKQLEDVTADLGRKVSDIDAVKDVGSIEFCQSSLTVPVDFFKYESPKIEIEIAKMSNVPTKSNDVDDAGNLNSESFDQSKRHSKIDSVPTSKSRFASIIKRRKFKLFFPETHNQSSAIPRSTSVRLSKTDQPTQSLAVNSSSTLNPNRHQRPESEAIDSKASGGDADQLVVALYAYSAREDYELSIRPGDTVLVIAKHVSGWWKGKLTNGSVGYFPKNYTAAIMEETVGRQVNSPSKYVTNLSNSPRKENVKALETRKTGSSTIFNSGAVIGSGPPVPERAAHPLKNPDSLVSNETNISRSISKPKKSPLANPTDQEKVEKPEIGVKPDIVKIRDSKKIDGTANTTELCPEPAPCNYAIAIFDYEAQDTRDLSIKVREILTVHGIDKEGGWMDASKANGKRGIVPANYVREYIKSWHDLKSR